MVAVVLLVVATLLANEVPDQGQSARQDQIELSKIAKQMNTVCVGRFLISLPTDAQVELGRARIDGISVSAFEEAQPEFEKRLSDRETEIKETPDRSGGNKNLESTSDVATDSGLIGKVFVHGRTVSEGTRAKGLEIEHYRHEGIAAEALVHADGISIDLVSDNRGIEWLQDISRLAKNSLRPQKIASPQSLHFASTGPMCAIRLLLIRGRRS